MIYKNKLNNVPKTWTKSIKNAYKNIIPNTINPKNNLQYENKLQSRIFIELQGELALI